jgi:hypothetical protein
LRGLAGLADLRPVVVIDSREQAPLVFARLQSVAGTLYSGDYSVLGLEDVLAVERKSLDDLANCCLASGRDRFEHELPVTTIRRSRRKLCWRHWARSRRITICQSCSREHVRKPQSR